MDAGEHRKMRPAEDEALAVAAKEEEKLTRKARLAEKTADRATSRMFKRVLKSQKRVCSEGRAVARCGESVAWHSVSLGGVFVHEVQDISGSTRALEKMQTSTE